MQVIMIHFLENTISVSFDTRPERCIGEACQPSLMCFRLSLINWTSTETYVVFYLSCIISRFNVEKQAKQMKKQMQFCSHLPTTKMSISVLANPLQSSLLQASLDNIGAGAVLQ